ncbi:MAG: bifunctional glutamate N-acetyltransferase/amino-acid acetyltransferase ArgJ [Saccharofermentanales bacterium]
MKFIDGSITSPEGFYAAGVSCGLKKNGNPDLAMISSSVESAACGVFTKNIVKGHSLKRTKSVISSGKARAIVINSGNANACVGVQGDLDAVEMADYTAKLIGCSADDVLTGSTGVIGHQLDMVKIKSGLKDAYLKLDHNTESGHLAELAIMTTDTIPKEFTVTLMFDGKKATISGMAKGSGMIHPDMATMISIITTDCAISRDMLQKALSSVTDKSYNRVSVDGDTSVCDMVIILANGLAGNKTIISENSDDYKIFAEALEAGCVKLAKLIAADGEGATKLIEIQVKNARSAADALKILNAVAKSPLVKTAMFGEDANWGRIFTAIGYSGVSFDPDLCDIYFGDLQVCSKGAALLFDESLAKEILAQKEIHIIIDLNDGDVNDRFWTCDFTYDYVKINGSYRS